MSKKTFREQFGFEPVMQILHSLCFISPKGVVYKPYGLRPTSEGGTLVCLRNAELKLCEERALSTDWTDWKSDVTVPGKLFFIEGVDSVGKATHTTLLAKYLNETGHPTITKTYPAYDTEVGGVIKDYLNGRFGDAVEVDPTLASFLYIADRAKDKNLITMALESGINVVCDRSPYSNAAFQASKAENKDQFEKEILDIEFNDMRFPYPEAVFLLDGAPDKVKALLDARKSTASVADSGEKDQHEANRELLNSAYDRYVTMAENNVRRDWHSIPVTSGDQIRDIEDIQQEIRELVLPYLNEK